MFSFPNPGPGVVAALEIGAGVAIYARPGEVLVSQEVIDASSGAEVALREIGPIELRGVSDVIRLHAAHRPGSPGWTTGGRVGSHSHEGDVMLSRGLRRNALVYRFGELHNAALDESRVGVLLAVREANL